MESRLVPILRDDSELLAAALTTDGGDSTTQFVSSSPINSNAFVARGCDVLNISG